MLRLFDLFEFMLVMVVSNCESFWSKRRARVLPDDRPTIPLVFGLNIGASISYSESVISKLYKLTST